MGLAWSLLTLVAFGDHNYGPVEPVNLPEITVTRHDGVKLSLRQAVGTGRVAVQFVFTDCQTACPLLGSLFRNVERALGGQGGAVELVSITVNPAADTPEKLAAWRKKFSADSRWIALRPAPEDLRTVLAVFGEKDPAPAAHSKQVYFVDGAKYVARSTELPRAALIAAALRGRAPMAGIGEAPVALAPEASTGLRGRVGDDWLTVEASRCANCHAGGGEGKIVVPPLTAESLLRPQPRRGGPASHYTQERFCSTLATGVDPAGIVLSPVMPRYELNAVACAAIWRSLTGQDSHQ